MAEEVSNNKGASPLFYFLKSATQFWFFMLVAFICDGFITLIGMMPPLFAVIIFDYAYPHGDLNIFTIFTLVGFAIYFLDFIFSAYIDYMNIYVHQRIDYDLTLKLFKKIESLPLNFISRIKIGDLTVRLTSDVGIIVRFVVNIFADIAMNLIKLGVFLYITLKFDYKVTVMALLSVPLYMLETKFFSGKLQNVQQEMQETDSDIMDGIQNKLLSIRTIKAFTQQVREAEDLGVRLRKSFVLSVKESIVSIINVFTNSLTIQAWSTFIGWYLGYEVITGRLTIGELVALSIYLPLLEGPIRELAGVYKSFKLTTVSGRRVMKIMQAEDEHAASGKYSPIEIKSGEIVFDNVMFSYQENVPTIKNFSLHISPNTSIAFVGDSGSGKSTLLNLLLRFYEPQSGRILVDGQDISKIDVNSLRQQMGVVFQETAVVPGTIRENILYGLEERRDEEIVRAANDACAHDFIKMMPDGYSSIIMPQGKNLSGGQQQRIAIARIILRNPKIFILDEPTSALDAASEFMIQEALNRMIGKRTLLIVAHRLSTIKKIERIVVMSKGSIVEEGRFMELMEKKGEFFKLYNLQFGGFQKFAEIFGAEFQRVLRYNQDLSLIMVEVPEFEDMIQNYHPNVASKFMEDVNIFIKKQVRIMDICAVYLNNKIVVALPETNNIDAFRLLKRIENKMKDYSFEHEDEKFGATIRAGLVSCKEMHAQQGEDLFEMANKVLAQMPRGMTIRSYSDSENTIYED